MGDRAVEGSSRREGMAWLAFLLSAPALLCLLSAILTAAIQLLQRMAPRSDSLKATLYSTDAGDTVRVVLTVCALGSAAGVALGLHALRGAGPPLSASATPFARAAVATGLVFVPVAALALLFR
jgi:hypothetical protein